MGSPGRHIFLGFFQTHVYKEGLLQLEMGEVTIDFHSPAGYCNHNFIPRIQHIAGPVCGKQFKGYRIRGRAAAWINLVLAFFTCCKNLDGLSACDNGLSVLGRCRRLL